MEFNRDYYEGGNYADYLIRRQERYVQQAKDVLGVVGRHQPPVTSFLDFGCAIGGLVSVLHGMGIKVVGTDISAWAVEYGRKQHGLSSDVLQHYNRQLVEQAFDCVMFLDVLEHMFDPELFMILSLLTAPFLLVRVPVSLAEGQDFVLDAGRNDKTHIQVHCKSWWAHLFHLHHYQLAEIIVTPSIYDSPGVLARLYRRV